MDCCRTTAKEKSRRPAALLTRLLYRAAALIQSRRFFLPKIQRGPFYYASFPAAIGGCRHASFTFS